MWLNGVAQQAERARTAQWQGGDAEDAAAPDRRRANAPSRRTRGPAVGWGCGRRVASASTSCRLR